MQDKHKKTVEVQDIIQEKCNFDPSAEKEKWACLEFTEIICKNAKLTIDRMTRTV